MDKESMEMFQKILDRLDSMDGRLDVMDFQFTKVDERFDVMGMKQGLIAKKLDDLWLDVKIAERDIREDFHKFGNEMGTVIDIIKGQ